MHDRTAVRTEGIAGLFRQFPEVEALGQQRAEGFHQECVQLAGRFEGRPGQLCAAPVPETPAPTMSTST